MNLKFDSHVKYEFLQKEKNLANKKMYSNHQGEAVKIQITLDKNVPPGKFIQSKIVEARYHANEVTIRALRKEIFTNMHNDTFEELEYFHQCESCKEVVDLQFWYFCPFCEKRFSKNPEKFVEKSS